MFQLSLRQEVFHLQDNRKEAGMKQFQPAARFATVDAVCDVQEWSGVMYAPMLTRVCFSLYLL